MPTLQDARQNIETQEAHRKFGVYRLLTPQEVAGHLNLPLSTLYEMARKNRIAGVVRLGRRLRFDSKKLEAWLEAGGQALPGGWRQESSHD